MGFGADLTLAVGAYVRRPRTKAKPAAQPARAPGGRRTTGSARTSEADADEAAGDAVVQVQAYIEHQARQTAGGQPRGMARQIAMCALLLEQVDPQDSESSLARIARVFQAAGATTPAALRKYASEARAILQYGVAREGLNLPADPGQVLARIDELILAIKPREIFERRARHLSGQRGGRPGGGLFKVLSAVALLKQNAGSGDPKAEGELRLVRTFLLDD
jgi:hypothetical protein